MSAKVMRLKLTCTVALALTPLFCGCQTQTKRSGAPPTVLGAPGDSPPPKYVDAAAVPTRDDIVSIHQFWPQVPWLRDTSGKAVGFRVPVYFVSGET
ncbi:MAG: hypothetical protein D6744_12275, partial [Planctomycetota bacterium]